METIRNARAGDLPAIVAIYNASIPGRLATADTEPVTVGEREAWFLAFSEARPLWVVEFEGQVAAWLSFRAFYGRPAYHRTAELGVYVAPEHHRRGFAGRLLAQAIARAPDLGIRTLLAFVFSHNQPSVALFARHGFEGYGKLPRVAELDGVERDLLIMGLRLDARVPP